MSFDFLSRYGFHNVQKTSFLSVKKTFVVFLVPLMSFGVDLKNPENISVTLKAEQIFEKNKTFQNVKVGGLSELFFEPISKNLFALSDAKTQHRFYKMALTTNPCCHIQIKEQIFLKSPKHKTLKRNMDPEALIGNGSNQLFIASEGQQIFDIHEPTQIFTFNKYGVLQAAWPVPPVFWKDEPQGHQAENFGQQENKGFESLTADNQFKTLWTATEKPLKQDLMFSKKAFVRLSAFDISTKRMSAQYGYALHNAQDGGLTALEWLKPKVFISLERVYQKKNNKGINHAYLFLVNCQKADNISKWIQLKKGFKACHKWMLWNSSKSSSIKVDNLEGLALIPKIFLKEKNQNSLLVLVSDNNFNEAKQKTQFLFFELKH